MQNPLRKSGREVPEPEKSGEVLKAKRLGEKPELLSGLLDDMLADEQKMAANDIDQLVGADTKSAEDYLTMEVDVPAVDLDARNFLQKFWHWLRGDNNYKHLMCIQKTALARRKLQSMLKEALSRVDKDESAMIKAAFLAYEKLWNYLAKNFQGRRLNLGDEVAWDEFLLVLDENDQARGVGKFPGSEQIQMLLRKYHKDRDVMRLLFSKVVKQEFPKLELLIQSKYFDHLKHPFKYMLMAQLAPRSAKTIARALKIFAALPESYLLNHTRTFGIIQFADFSNAEQITADIVEAAMQAGLANEKRVAT